MAPAVIFLKWLAGRIMLNQIKSFLKRKTKASVKSATMGVAGGLVGVGLWVQSNPEVLRALVPDNYEGVAIALVGLVVAVARLRTAGNGTEG